jgi:hypothetical protein
MVHLYVQYFIKKDQEVPAWLNKMKILRGHRIMDEIYTNLAYFGNGKKKGTIKSIILILWFHLFTEKDNNLITCSIQFNYL